MANLNGHIVKWETSVYRWSGLCLFLRGDYFYIVPFYDIDGVRHSLRKIHRGNDLRVVFSSDREDLPKV